MDTVIRQLSEIETKSLAVMEEANERMKTYAREMEEKTAEFDRQLDLETESKIKDLRREKEAESNAKRSSQQARAEEILQMMDQNYEENHESYVHKLFQELIKE